MNKRQRRSKALVAEVWVELGDLARHQHALVNAGPRGEARRVEVGAGGQLDDPANHITLALKGILIAVEAGAGGDNRLTDVWPRAAGGHADEVLVDWDVAPAKEDLTLNARIELDQLLQLAAALRVVRQEANANGVEAGLGQLELEHTAQECVRDLNEDAGAVAARNVGALGATVLKIVERLQRLLNYAMRRDVVELRDHRHATGIVLISGVVEALRPWAFDHRHCSVALRAAGSAPAPGANR